MCTHTWQWIRDDKFWFCILCGKRSHRYPASAPLPQDAVWPLTERAGSAGGGGDGLITPT